MLKLLIVPKEGDFKIEAFTDEQESQMRFNELAKNDDVVYLKLYDLKSQTIIDKMEK